MTVGDKNKQRQHFDLGDSRPQISLNPYPFELILGAFDARLTAPSPQSNLGSLNTHTYGLKTPGPSSAWSRRTASSRSILSQFWWSRVVYKVLERQLHLLRQNVRHPRDTCSIVELLCGRVHSSLRYGLVINSRFWVSEPYAFTSPPYWPHVGWNPSTIDWAGANSRFAQNRPQGKLEAFYLVNPLVRYKVGG